MSLTPRERQDQADAAWTPEAIAETVRAVAQFRNQDDQWGIADALLRAVPSESSQQRAKFDRIRRQARDDGIKPLSISSMRQYRDCASRWTPDKRIDGVSYTAHRAALSAPDPEAILRSVVGIKGGPDKVSVKDVRDAVNAATGTVTATQAKKQAAAQAAAQTIDWTDPETQWVAFVMVSGFTDEQLRTIAKRIDDGTGKLPANRTAVMARYVNRYQTLAATLSKLAGLDRGEAKKVGKSKPKAEKPKAPANQPGKSRRRGRVVGA